jgi:hypothetical protein
MIEALISSKTRINLLVKFFLHPGTRAYLRGLSQEFNESTNSIRLELNRFEDAGLLVSSKESNKKYYQANSSHPFFSEIKSLVLKHTGVSQIIDKVIQRLGKVEEVYIVGAFSKSTNTDHIDLCMIGDIKEDELRKVVEKAEGIVERKINCMVIAPEEYDRFNWDAEGGPGLLIWNESMRG